VEGDRHSPLKDDPPSRLAVSERRGDGPLHTPDYLRDPTSVNSERLRL